VSTHQCATEHCIRPAQTQICPGCLADLTRSLRHLATGEVQRVRVHKRNTLDEYPEEIRIVDRHPGLLADLEDSITRQAVHGNGSGTTGRLSEKPVPFHEAASDLAHSARNTLTTWARVVLDQHPHLQLGDITTAGIAAWLSRLPTILAMLPGAGQMVDEVTRLADQVRRMVDRSPDRVYLGICSAVDEETGAECPEDVYALPTQATVRCRACGTEHDIEYRRNVLLTAVDDQLLTAIELSRALPGLLGEDLSVNTVRSWANRKMLAAKAHDATGRALYRVGDVITLRSRLADTRVS
jgi:hypothetical protein